MDSWSKDYLHGNRGRLINQRSMSRILLYILVAFSAEDCLAQFVILDETKFAASENAIIAIETASDLEAADTKELNRANIIVTLNGTDQKIKGSWTVDTLHIQNGTITSVEGMVTVTGKMNFANGILQPIDFSATNKSKIIFTGEGRNLLWEVGNNSFVNGEFFQAGEGKRTFPVGSLEDDLIATLILEDVQTDNEVGVRLVADDPGFATSPILPQIDVGKYWLINTADLVELETRVGIPTEGITLVGKQDYVVAQADGPNQVAENLGNSSDKNGFAYSDGRVSKPLIVLATSEEVRLTIRDLITPSAKVNNRMVIDNIDAFQENRVRLLDRWGSLIHEWQNFTNDNNDFDFSTLTPGNYICVVECWNEGASRVKRSQMITVIKTR